MAAIGFRSSCFLRIRFGGCLFDIWMMSERRQPRRFRLHGSWKYSRLTSLSAGCLMAITAIADEQHVARHVRSRLLQRQNGNVVGCFPQAFELRAATATREAETYLSASWLEFFVGDRATKLRQTLLEMRNYLEVKAKDALAIANVGKIKEVGRVRNTRLRVLHEPAPPLAPAYAAIRGLRRDDTEILGLLAAEAVADMVEIAAIDQK